ncbi:protein GRINL1A [Pelobates fuscus]|uniref:protein GRINL1A n=1 Tax=Pelobates fuscus TaxID=191477 RepID=UPI002FE4ACA7
MSVSGEHGGVELQGKSLAELLEILHRQEKLINNTKFIAKLPDRGKKIMEFTEKVRLAIGEHMELTNRKEVLSKLRREFQERQHDGEEATIIASALDSSIHINKQLDKIETEAAPTNLLLAEEYPTVSENGDTHHLDGSSVLVEKSRSSVLDPDALLNDLKNITLKDIGEETSRDYGQGKNPFNSSRQKKSHFIEVIEKRALNPVYKKEKFKTNRLPPGSDCSTPCDSPVENQIKLSAEERRAIEKKHLDDITAARLPPLYHAPSQLLSLEESIALQLSHKQSHEENQAKLAAQRLIEKLGIKMEKFNPEGDSYMKYRDIRDSEDSEN